MRKQSPLEERLNAWSHGLGVLMGVVALVLMLVYNTHKTPYSTFAIWVYGLSIIILFTASTLYHAMTREAHKHYFRVLDHISIYLLIAGTYTPVTLITLVPSSGWLLFGVVWGIAALGLLLKLFFTGKFETVSVLLYLAMGWLVVFDFSYLSEALGPQGVLWLFAGGLAYTLGIVFYAIERIPYNHVIWHGFVLAGALCHVVMVLGYVV